jgi:hypothetical protein
MTLTADGKELLGNVLGSACVRDQAPPVIVIGATPTAFDVITVPSATCRLSRFRLTDNLGRLTTPTAVQLRSPKPKARVPSNP